jgi:sRNA-binding carbon storage regulator CsrA
MLVLSVSARDGVTVLKDGVKIVHFQILSDDRGKIKLGITAGREYVILRDELLEAAEGKK